MEHPERHPDDERLAALVDAEADTSLREHVATCERCRALVADLRTLRTALADLPDIAPSRPMRLLPAVDEPRRSRVGGVARRLFAPALIGGLALGVVGGAGSLSTLGEMMAASGAAAPLREVAAPSAGDQGKSLDSASHGGATATQRPEPESFNAFKAPSSDVPAPIVWPLLLVAGLVLIGLALILRFVVQPRAG